MISMSSALLARCPLSGQEATDLLPNCMADKPEIDGATLDRLFAVIASRVGADPALSYTAQLLRAGTCLLYTSRCV